MSATLPEIETLLTELRSIAGHAEAVELGELCQRAAETASAARELDGELERLRTKLQNDVATLNADLGRELPLVVRDASVDDLKRHFSAFVERSFQTWLEAELAEIESELGALAERGDALVREAEAAALRPSVIPEIGTRALEVDSFPRDFGVFALSTVGIAVLFSNALLGGALLVLAPFVARYSRERTEVELRERAATEAGRAVREATERLQVELLKRLDAFAAELLAFALRASERARAGALELHARSGSGEDWQQRLGGLVPQLQALSPASTTEQNQT
ncbi:MAG TPA: hypothetical protein VM686_01230 [Polyangiaceae bacterium]|nr:hypothetical protein [Polyangiaceae bacterium]